MLSIFCLRLASGLIASLLIFSRGQIPLRFYRSHYLIVLGLISVAMIASWEAIGLWQRALCGVTIFFIFAGSIAWSLENVPYRSMCNLLVLVILVAGLILAARPMTHSNFAGWFVINEITSGLVLGLSMTAMLMGHSYLTAPTLSVKPLLHILKAFVAIVLVRMIVAMCGLWSWSNSHSLTNLEDETVLWLPVRWGIGFLAPLVLGWMAWQSARIRSTQAATGILYVVVIFCFLGELTSQLLVAHTRFLL